MRAILLPLLGFALLDGCAGGTIDAPSLGLRAVEKQPVELPDQASEPQVPVDPALTARIATIESAANAGHAEFETARARAAVAVEKAANAPAGSELWTIAQQQLSEVDAARGPVAHAAAEIDALRIEPANATSGNRTAIEAAGERIGKLSEAEAAAVAALGGRLKD